MGDFQGREPVLMEKGEGEQGSGAGVEAVLLHEIPRGSLTGISGSPQNPRLPFSDRVTTCPFYSQVIPCLIPENSQMVKYLSLFVFIAKDTPKFIQIHHSTRSIDDSGTASIIKRRENGLCWNHYF
jgi:hypothetical protein